MSGAKRLLVANVHYAPWSYGGATVVVEAMCERLVRDHGWQVLVLTTFFDPSIASYTLRRYTVNGVDIAAICVPSNLPYRDKYLNRNYDLIAKRVIDAFAPDVAHVHCVQNMGAGCIKHLVDSGVPTAVTVHDAWWWCERQFLITDQGVFCHQTKVDHRICRYCITDVNVTLERKSELMSILGSVDKVLFPSDYFRGLGVANGLLAERCQTNKNGVLPPKPGFQRSRSPVLRFGYVGGPGPNKGVMQILRAFREIKRTDYELVIVDAAQNLGRSWRNEIDWSVPGKLVFHPAYQQATIDGFFGSIDVLLFPSLWKESFGLTVREALLRNVWVIASDAGGTAEDCEDGVNSTVIPMSTDHKRLKAAITALLEKGLPSDYENPHRSAIVTSDEQASELSRLLHNLSAPAKAVPDRITETARS